MLGSVLISFIVIGGIYYINYISTVRTIDKIKYGIVNKNIENLDRSLLLETVFVYEDNNNTYLNLRENILQLFQNDYYSMEQDAIYIDSNRQRISA